MEERKSKHYLVSDILRHDILLGKYTDRFPSEHMLVRRFGVSRQTVNRALIDLKHEGLLESKTGSGTFLSAKALRSAGYLGMIVPDRNWNNFFSALAGEIEAAAHRLGYTVLKDDYAPKTDSFRADAMIALAQEFVQKRVKGVLLEPFDTHDQATRVTKTILDILKKAQIPVVLLDRDIERYPERSAYDLVGIDNVRAGFVAARHLLDRGAKHIAFLDLPLSGDASRERIIGVGQAVVEAGGKWTRRSVMACEPIDARNIKRELANAGHPDGIVCRNDHVAAHLFQSLSDLGIRVPRDILIVGFDDCSLAESLTPPLTSVRQPTEKLARLALDTLFARLRDPDRPISAIRLSADLVARKSTRRLI